MLFNVDQQVSDLIEADMMKREWIQVFGAMLENLKHLTIQGTLY
jgi:hypothetical protein